MNLRAFCLLSLTLAFTTRAHTQTPPHPTCPWITEGTIATLLDGSPTLTVKSISPTEGSCRFTLGGATALEITVAPRPPKSCPPGSSRLTGIGNEAVVCHIPASTEQKSREVVESRVRTAYFSVTLTQAAPSEARQRDAVTRIAELVAGNLF